MNPDILLLDEPFASIDPTSRKQFIQILARLHQAGKTILVCDHDFNDYADVVDQVVTLKTASLKTTVDVYQNKTADISAYNFCGKTTNAQLKNFRLSQENECYLKKKKRFCLKELPR